MDTRDDWREWECCSPDEHAATPSDSDIDTASVGDKALSDVRAAAPPVRIMVIGFTVIRL